MEISSCNLIYGSSGYTDVDLFVGGNILLDNEAATLMCFVGSIKFNYTHMKGLQFISEYELNV